MSERVGAINHSPVSSDRARSRQSVTPAHVRGSAGTFDAGSGTALEAAPRAPRLNSLPAAVDLYRAGTDMMTTAATKARAFVLFSGILSINVPR